MAGDRQRPRRGGTLLTPPTPGADATPRGDNGRIAIRQYFNQQHTHGAIFTVKPDGTGLFQVTHPGPGFLTTEPEWSPDGRWIVYFQNAKGQDQYDGPDRIYKIRATGIDRTYLSRTCTGSCVSDYGPSFSPDGTHIVFNRDTGQCDSGAAPCLTALYVMRSDGTRVRRVTQRHATPSPDGNAVAVGPSTPPRLPSRLRAIQQQARCPRHLHRPPERDRHPPTHPVAP